MRNPATCFALLAALGTVGWYLGLRGPHPLVLLLACCAAVISLRTSAHRARPAVLLIGLAAVSLATATVGDARTYAWTLLYLQTMLMAQQCRKHWSLAISTGSMPLAVGVYWGFAHHASILATVPHAVFVALAYNLFSTATDSLHDVEAEQKRLQLAQVRAEQDGLRVQGARKAHDGIGSTLAAACLHSEVANLAAKDDPERARAAAERVAGLVAQALAEIEGIDTETADTRWAALGNAVRDWIDALARGLEGRVALECMWTGDESSLLARDCAETLSSSIRELVGNAIAHARARRISVEGICDASGAMRVRVRDDGVGLGQAAPGFGRTQIGSRWTALGGEARWEPSAPHGTIATLELPAPVEPGASCAG